MENAVTMNWHGRNITRPPQIRPGSRSVRPRPTPKQPFVEDCGSCDNVECIFNALEVFFIVGVFTNLIVVVQVARKPVLRTPTFITIACLALADAMFLSMNLISIFERLIRTLSCTMPTEIAGTLVLRTFSGITWFAASSHVTLIAVIRFVMIAYPLKFRIWLRTKILLILSIALWIFGGAMFGIIAALTATKRLNAKSSLQTKFAVWISVFLMPVVVTSVLHVIKLRKIKKRSDISPNRVVKTSIKRMSKIILTVIILAVVLPAPRLISLVLEERDVTCSTKTCRSTLRNVFFMLFLLNSFINPVIYAFMSPTFRRHLLPKCMNALWERSFRALSTFRSTRTVSTSASTNNSYKSNTPETPYTISKV